jgi:hypothetical protein
MVESQSMKDGEQSNQGTKTWKEEIDERKEKGLEVGTVRMKLVGEDGKEYTIVGGPELLPKEEFYDFGDLKKLLTTKDETSNWLFRGADLLDALFSNDPRQKIPFAVEVGRVFGSSTQSALNTTLEIVKYKGGGGINNLFDADIVSPKTGGRNYVVAPVEVFSQVFGEGRRPNLIYLGNVLTDDDAGAALHEEKQRKIVLEQLYKSLIPGGVMVVNNNTGFSGHSAYNDNDYIQAGFEVLFGGEYITFLQKPKEEQSSK